jgi:hypothetical protein
MPHNRKRPRTARRLVWLALAVSAFVHVVILGLVVLRAPAGMDLPTILLLPAGPEAVDLPAPERPAAGPEATESARPEPGPARAAPPLETPAVSIPTPAPGAPESATIPQTGLVQLHAPVLPLVATPYGVTRRPVVRDARRLAIARAESLVNARIASVIEVRPPVQAGPVSLQPGGGVSIPVPWGGFIRDDRDDETWREKRCRGDEKDGGDDAGEGEARRAQCD